MSQLHLSFLGHPEVRHGERLLNFRTRKVLALLIFLAVEGGRHSREKLTTFFWPESDHKSGRATLRSTLLYLRRALQHTDKDAPTHLIVTRETLSFNSDTDYTLDCERLSRLARSPDPLSNDPMAPLLTLYRGDFLEGFTLPDAPAFDEWARIQREQYHLHMNEMFDRLSQITAARGATPDGIQVINRWLALNPLHEPAYRRLIRLHLTDENRAAAQQVYEACRHHFQEELGIELSPETMALAEQIRAGTRSRPVPIKEETPPLAPLADTLLPFVGRAVEHTELVTAYHTARQGRLQLIVVEGEAGIGKTRLAHEFLAWAAAQGADILVGQAFETGGRLPYQPIVAALRDRIEQENAPEDLLADIWLSELSRLLPELGDRYPDLPPPLAKETAVPSRLFEAVTRLVQALTVRKSVVIFMDDMQWADSATLDLLAYAVRRWHERAVSLVLLLTLRTEALAQVPGSLTLPAVAAWLPGLARHLEIKRLKLPPLTTAATRELVQKASQEREESTPANSNLRPTILFAKWLFGETEGHPLFMTETVKNLLDEGILVKRGEVWDVAAALRLVEETFDKTFIPAVNDRF